MSFIRPEASAAVWRWRELVVGVLLALLAIWWFLGPKGLLGWIAPVVLVGAIALIAVGLQLGRFRGTGTGTGLGAVQVDEGQITYYGPLTGGTIALRELSLLKFDGSLRSAHWILEQNDGPALMIPVDAAGADVLFDAFAVLPGLQTERILKQLRNRPEGVVLMWERSSTRLIGQLSK